MEFSEVTLEDFLNSRDAASDLLRENGRVRGLSLPETLVLQGSNHLLDEEGLVHAARVARLIRLTLPSVYLIFDRFEEQAVFAPVLPGSNRNQETIYRSRIYTPTDLGSEVLSLFES